jgi:hypothetical protein
MWPKGIAQIQNKTWACEAHEGGILPGGRFILSLFVVRERGFENINAWLEHGKMTDDCPGLVHLKDAKSLSRVRLCLVF